MEAVCDLFRGQEVCRSEFTVTRDAGDLAFEETGLGIGNRLTLLDDQIFENLRSVQLRNGVPPSGNLESVDFTVEMETGTGKTYVPPCRAFQTPARCGIPRSHRPSAEAESGRFRYPAAIEHEVPLPDVLTELDAVPPAPAGFAKVVRSGRRIAGALDYIPSMEYRDK